MSLGSAEPTSHSTPPGPVFRTRFGARVRRCLGLIVAVGWLSGAMALPARAAGLPGTSLAQIDRPAAGAPAFSQSAEDRRDVGRSPAIASVEGAANSLSDCERAGIAMEQASGLPPGLLLAIGRVESGRWDSMRGRVAAWPWTINAAGKGLWFTTEDAAARTVRDLLNGGTRSIDVGCFQINLQWHPTAFASLEQAFDPDANAAYAARFLLALFSQTGSWDAAVEAYHSTDPALGYAYRQQVFSTWAAAPPIAAIQPFRARAVPLLAVASRPIAMPMVIAGVQIWTPMPLGTASDVVAMPGSPGLEQPRAVNDAAAPLPVVLYHALPPGMRPAQAMRTKVEASRVVSARVTPSR
jgi:hypothetical protein